jgi:hypothetical protein
MHDPQGITAIAAESKRREAHHQFDLASHTDLGHDRFDLRAHRADRDPATGRNEIRRLSFRKMLGNETFRGGQCVHRLQNGRSSRRRAFRSSGHDQHPGLEEEPRREVRVGSANTSSTSGEQVRSLPRMITVPPAGGPTRTRPTATASMASRSAFAAAGSCAPSCPFFRRTRLGRPRSQAQPLDMLGARSD